MYQYEVSIWYTKPNGNSIVEKTTINYPKRIYDPKSEELIRVAANNLGLDFYRIKFNQSDTKANFIGEDGDNSSSSSNSGPMGNNVSWSESGLGKLTGWAFGKVKNSMKPNDENESKPDEEKEVGRSVEQLKADMKGTIWGDIFSSPKKEEKKKDSDDYFHF